MTIKFEVNGQSVEFDGAADMPLLWYLRDYAGLTGTKFGCGIAACGACTVHVDGKAQRSCVTPLAALEGRAVRTIEQLASGDELHAVQQAWLVHDVPQCGYCQAGQLMAAADLLERVSEPDDDDIATITNICRCGTYPRIRAAIKTAAKIKLANASKLQTNPGANPGANPESNPELKPKPGDRSADGGVS